MNVNETPVSAKLTHGAKIPSDGIIALAMKGIMATDIIVPVSTYILAIMCTEWSSKGIVLHKRHYLLSFIYSFKMLMNVNKEFMCVTVTQHVETR